MGQRGLLPLEKTYVQLLWTNLWHFNKHNMSLHYFNNNLRNLYFFYLFLYERQLYRVAIISRSALLNVKSRARLPRLLSIRVPFLNPAIHHIMRYNMWLIIVIFFLKINKSQFSIINKILFRTNYTIFFS